MRFFVLEVFVIVSFVALPTCAHRNFGGSHGVPGLRQGNASGRPGRGGRGGQGVGQGGGQGGANTFVTVATPVAAAPSQGAVRNGNNNNGNSNGNGNGNAGTGRGGAVDASLIPPFGITAGIRANDGTQNCVGVGGKGIPCDCPPSANTLAPAIQDQVDRGARFPTGNSVADQLARVQTSIVALQNFKGGPGSGVGCPAVSTTWVALRTQLESQL